MRVYLFIFFLGLVSCQETIYPQNSTLNYLQNSTNNTVHPYYNVNVERNNTYWTIPSKNFRLGSIADYRFERRVGEGVSSMVVKGVKIATNEVVVMKGFKPLDSNQILMEARILEEVKDAPNVLPLLDVVWEKKNNQIKYGFIFSYFESVNFKLYYNRFTSYQIKYYIYQVLRTLDYAHSRGVMHQDIKPVNILMSVEPLQVRIIDWGASDYYMPNKSYNINKEYLRVRAPEMALKLMNYNYAVDIWSTGCLLGEMIFRNLTLFKPLNPKPKYRYMRLQDLDDQNAGEHLDAVARILGTKDLREYAEKFQSVMDVAILSRVGDYEKVPLSSLTTPLNSGLVEPVVLDLLEQMLTYDHTQRITASDALKHPYFDEVRQQ